MEFSVDLLNSLAKRGWKIIVWVFPLNMIFSIYLFILILIERKLFSVNNFVNIDSDVSALLSFLIQNISFSFVILLIFYIIKGDSGDKIKKMRSKFYQYCRLRVYDLFSYRYNPPKSLDEDIMGLVGYYNSYEKKKISHKVELNNLSYKDLLEIDSLYIVYKINDDEKVLFSVWHTGNKISIAIAFNINHLEMFRDMSDKEVFANIEQTYKGKLNISDAKDTSIQIREKYFWFDIVYNVNEELLVHSIEQEDISRKIAHIVTVGLPIAMGLMGWKVVK